MKLKIDHQSAVPLHKQAELILRKLIEKEEYVNGKLLPKETDLSEQLKISRNTLRQAISQLVTEGLLVRKKGVGTRVIEKRIFSESNNWLSFSQEMEVLNIDIHNFELSIKRQLPSKEAQAFFEVDDSEKLFKVQRLREKKDLPFVYFSSEFSPLIPFSETENFFRPLYEILEKDYNIIVKTSKEEISAASADTFIADKLEINIGDPILIRKRFVYDIHDKPIEYNIGWYRANSFTYKIVSVRDVKVF